ncbi:phosphopantothenatecysteine ligase [Heterostelium album PN500]|uniref:Phosphopantothenatecysteine ligase n=1 Tax=Heterostelium pallidum (strain ATCC 26659 / Pp 5 / PN500) TaxID=670386 RepID=D3B2G1_HETP5|nr:phosphopantothenatecysteine ligase [Heterostelium album PN500]EFA83509.1 phosphopantothenatecysteine ligase [Heterostelium album PN500]|eukprot:XP_020435626.1 phosphopantothenatecysteine ligase [Heterostelium album PN500]
MENHINDKRYSLEDLPENVAKFYRSVPFPHDYATNFKSIKEFARQCQLSHSKTILITSGGTIVPIEKNMVRYLDNFSGGGRGAATAEYFLEHGYHVLFLYRKNSLQPFIRHLMLHDTNFFTFLSYNPEQHLAYVSDTYKEQVSNLFMKWKSYIDSGRLLRVHFETVGEYLYYLRASTIELSTLKRNMIIFAAAAVSDFYIPLDQMSEHKIQSKNEGLTINLDPVPKLLKLVVSEWAPDAYTVSFKLETDINILDAKCQTSLNSYHHQLVIGNLLSDYKNWVVFHTPSKPAMYIRKTEQQIKDHVDIEPMIGERLKDLHRIYCDHPPHTTTNHNHNHHQQN